MMLRLYYGPSSTPYIGRTRDLIAGAGLAWAVAHASNTCGNADAVGECEGCR